MIFYLILIYNGATEYRVRERLATHFNRLSYVHTSKNYFIIIYDTVRAFNC